MLKKRTTFVLGAGASKEFGLPLGAELKHHVRTRLAQFSSPDQIGEQEPMAFALNVIGAHSTEIKRAADIARAAIPMYASIDDFLLQFRDFGLVAKLCRLAIAESILLTESQSSIGLLINSDAGLRGDGHELASRTWIGKLFRRLTFRSASAQDAVENLSFVVFNYDRCVEAYMLGALREAFALSNSDAAEIAATVPVLHVYGSMGPLPEYPGGEAPITFGAQKADMTKAAAAIRTYGEGHSDQNFLNALAGKMQESEAVVFLGYAFHPQGVSILYPHGPIAGQDFHATTDGLGLRASVPRELAGNPGWILNEQASSLLERLELV